MDPLTREINLTRSTKAPEKLTAWQSAPLRITASLYPATLDLVDAEKVVAQLRSQRTDDSSVAALAEKEETINGSNSAGPWTFDFTFTDLSIEIASGKKCREVWLNVTALWSDGRSEPLTVRAVEVFRNPNTTIPSTAASAVRVQDATLEEGEDTLSVTLAAGETIVNALAQSGDNVVQVLGVSYSGLTATIAFTGAASEDTEFKLVVARSGNTTDRTVRVVDASLTSGQSTIVLTILAGESVAGVLAQSGTNPLLVVGVEYSGSGNTTATITFTGAAAADTSFKITLQRP